jgi:RNA polymerase-associated protein RTF1
VESDDDPESEEDESNPYPLAGQYKDEADRQKLVLSQRFCILENGTNVRLFHRLMELSEIEREEIIAQRLEERQRLVDKANLNRLFKASAAAEKEKDSVSKAAKRELAINLRCLLEY